MIVWESKLTSEMVDEHLSTDELAELAHELDKAIQEICENWGVK
jgi:hypothetical protein